VTNALCIWKITEDQLKIGIDNGGCSCLSLSKPNYKYYNVENEPADVYKIG
jgi:hypothetical protein